MFCRGVYLSGLVVVVLVVGLLWSQFFVVIGFVGVVCFAHVLQRLYGKCTLGTVLGRGVGNHMTLCISRAGVG